MNSICKINKIEKTFIPGEIGRVESYSKDNIFMTNMWVPQDFTNGGGVGGLTCHTVVFLSLSSLEV